MSWIDRFIYEGKPRKEDTNDTTQSNDEVFTEEEKRTITFLNIKTPKRRTGSTNKIKFRVDLKEASFTNEELYSLPRPEEASSYVDINDSFLEDIPEQRISDSIELDEKDGIFPNLISLVDSSIKENNQ